MFCKFNQILINKTKKYCMSQGRFMAALTTNLETVIIIKLSYLNDALKTRMSFGI